MIIFYLHCLPGKKTDVILLIVIILSFSASIFRNSAVELHQNKYLLTYACLNKVRWCLYQGMHVFILKGSSTSDDMSSFFFMTLGTVLVSCLVCLHLFCLCRNRIPDCSGAEEQRYIEKPLPGTNDTNDSLIII